MSHSVDIQRELEVIFKLYFFSLSLYLLPLQEMQETQVWSLSWKDPLEEEIATRSTFAWKIPWTEEPGRLQSMGSLKSQTRLSDCIFTLQFHALEKEMATHSSILALRIPGMGEPGGLLSLGSHRVGHDWSNLAVAAAVAVATCFFKKIRGFIP